MPGAIEIAQQECEEFRKGLPINYLLHNGIAFDSDKVSFKSFSYIIFLIINNNYIQ
jgi:hypothetical protein